MSDQEYEEDDVIKCIKEDFDLNDFLENEITGTVLYEDAIQNYENNVEKRIERFYFNEVSFCNNIGTTIFDNECDYAHIDDLFKIVFKNINLKYNLDLIHNNEELMMQFADSEIAKKNISS